MMEDSMPGVKTREQTKTETQKRYRPLHFQASGHCTFCGAPMDPSETVCEECGMPAEGVVCPNCGTLNFRPFCSQCNAPLNRAAIRAVEKAEDDPKVQEVARLMDQAAELEEALENASDEHTRWSRTSTNSSRRCSLPLAPPLRNSSTIILPARWPWSASRPSNGPSKPDGCATTADAITANPVIAWSPGMEAPGFAKPRNIPSIPKPTNTRNKP